MRYRKNGEIDPIRLTAIGVGQYDAALPIPATGFFQALNATVAEQPDGRFQIAGIQHGSALVYPKIRNLHARPTLTLSASAIHPSGAQVEIRRSHPTGARLAHLELNPQPPQPASNADSTHSATLHGVRNTDDLCLTFQGPPAELLHLTSLTFA